MRRSQIAIALLAIAAIAIAAVPQVKDGIFYPIIRNPGFESCTVVEGDNGPALSADDWKMSGFAEVLGQPGETEDVGIAGNVCMLLGRGHSRIEQENVEVKPNAINSLVLLCRAQHGAPRVTVYVGYISDDLLPNGTRERIEQSILTPYRGTPASPWGDNWAYQEFKFTPKTSKGTIYVQGGCATFKFIRPVIVF